MQDEFVIREVNKSDLSQISKVHIESFPNFFLSKLGCDFVKQYYNLILNYDKHVFLCYAQNNEIIGFVSGFNNPKAFYKYLSEKKANFLYPLLVSVCRNPFVIVTIAKAFKRIKNEAQIDNNNDFTNELSSLAVNPIIQNKGVGKKLVDAYITVLKDSKIKAIQLTTDAENNDKVNSFYERLNFKKTKTIIRNDSRLMNEYCYYLDGND